MMEKVVNSILDQFCTLCRCRFDVVMIQNSYSIWICWSVGMDKPSWSSFYHHECLENVSCFNPPFLEERKGNAFPPSLHLDLGICGPRILSTTRRINLPNQVQQIHLTLYMCNSMFICPSGTHWMAHWQKTKPLTWPIFWVHDLAANASQQLPAEFTPYIDILCRPQKFIFSRWGTLHLSFARCASML